MAEFRAAWWWIDRWRKSTAYSDLTAEQQGLYRNLLDELWLRSGVLPTSDKALGQISGDYEAWARNRDVVLSRFYETPEGYRNRTHDEVSSRSRDAHASKVRAGRARWQGVSASDRSEAARSAAKSRWNASDASTDASRARAGEQAECEPPDPDPDQSPDTDQSPSPKGATTSRGARAIPPSPEAHDVAAYLRDAILEHTPDHACARNGAAEKWARPIDLALRRDRRSPDDLKAAVDFAHRRDHDVFWRANLLSGAKLRAHFDTLRIQAQRDRKFLADANTQTVAALRAWLEGS